MKVIAHGIKNQKAAHRAITYGADYLEIDISQRILFSKIIIQHNILLGKLGLGPIFETILAPSIKNKLFWDLKDANSAFSEKITNTITEFKIKNAKICGHNWSVISEICKKHNFEAYYTLKSKHSLEKFKKDKNDLKEPAGFSVRHAIIDKDLIAEIKNVSKNSKIWAWTVNHVADIKRLKELKIDGIITDSYEEVKLLA